MIPYSIQKLSYRIVSLQDASKASQFGNHLGDPDHLLSAKELSASQLHLLLHPTEEKDDAALRDNDNIICLNVGGKVRRVFTVVLLVNS